MMNFGGVSRKKMKVCAFEILYLHSLDYKKPQKNGLIASKARKYFFSLVLQTFLPEKQTPPGD